MVIGLHVSDELLKLAEEGFGRYIQDTEAIFNFQSDAC